MRCRSSSLVVAERCQFRRRKILIQQKQVLFLDVSFQKMDRLRVAFCHKFFFTNVSIPPGMLFSNSISISLDTMIFLTSHLYFE